MKTSNYSVKWKLFFYLSLFVVFILAVLWLFQIVLLDDVYKTIKTTEIKSTAEILKRSINDRDFSDKASKIAYNKDLCIIITDENGRQLLSIDAQNNCAIHKISSQSLYKLYNRAKAGGGSQLSKFKKDAFRGVYVDIENLEENTGSESDECIIYTVIASDSNNNNYDILKFIFN